MQENSRLLAAARMRSDVPLRCKLMTQFRSQLRCSKVRRTWRSSSLMRLSRTSRCVRCSRTANFKVSIVGSVSSFSLRSRCLVYLSCVSSSDDRRSMLLPARETTSTSDTCTWVICAVTSGNVMKRLKGTASELRRHRPTSDSGNVVRWLLCKWSTWSLQVNIK